MAEIDYDKLSKLVVKYQNGDSSAFEQIYNMTCQTARFTALKILNNNEADADDVLQECYIKVIEKIGTLKDPSSFMSWFNMIIANQAKNVLRKNNPALFSDDEEEQFIIDSIPDEDKEFHPSEDVEQDELRKDVMGLVDGLSDDKRTAVILFYYNEMTTKQIAESLGISENTVKSRLVQAKKDLAKGVKGLEKKNKSLLGVAPVPLIIWAFKGSAEAAAGAYIAGGGAAAAFAAITAATSSAAAAAGTTAAGAAAAGGIAAKIAGLTLTQKVIAGVVAVGIVTGGAVGTKAVVDNQKKKTAETDVTVTETTETMETTAEEIITSESVSDEETTSQSTSEAQTTTSSTTAATDKTSEKQTSTTTKKTTAKQTTSAATTKTTTAARTTAATTAASTTKATTVRQADVPYALIYVYNDSKSSWGVPTKVQLSEGSSFTKDDAAIAKHLNPSEVTVSGTSVSSAQRGQVYEFYIRK